MLRRGVAWLVANGRLEQVVGRLPASRGIASRFVPGTGTDDLLEACQRLVGSGCSVMVDLQVRPAADQDAADLVAEDYLALVEALARHGLARYADLNLRLEALGQDLPEVGAKLCLEHVRTIAAAARAAGVLVSLPVRDHRGVEPTLETLREVRRDFPETGAVLRANLRRTQDDCRALAHEGSRVRLTKGAADEPETVSYAGRHECDKAYVRCLKVLMAGRGYPVVATHDPRMIRIAGALATRFDRHPGSYEYQLRYGFRTDEQPRLLEAGERVRVAVPFGQDGVGYLLRRFAEQPSDLRSFVRSVLVRT